MSVLWNHNLATVSPSAVFVWKMFGLLVGIVGGWLHVILPWVRFPSLLNPVAPLCVSGT